MIKYCYISFFRGISFNSPETREEYKYVPESPWSIIHQEIFRLRRASPTSRLQDHQVQELLYYRINVYLPETAQVGLYHDPGGPWSKGTSSAFQNLFPCFPQHTAQNSSSHLLGVESEDLPV